MTTPLQVGVTITGDASSLAGAAARGERDLQRFGRTAESAGRAAADGFGAARRGVQSISGQLSQLQSLAAGALGIGSLGQATAGYIKAADAATNMASRLRLVSESSVAAERAQAELFRIAQASRVSFTDLGATYGQMARATQELGIGQTRLLGVTQAVSQAVALSGGSAQSAQAALVQLSQGLSAGALRGEELNSILEQTPRLAQAIAQGLGVGIGELRKLGEAGELTASRVLGAIERSAPELAREFAQVTPTVEAAFQTVRNSALNLVGTIDAGSGASRGLATAMQVLSQGLDSVAQSAAGASTALGPILAGAAAAAGVLALGAAIAGLKVALGGLVGVMAALAAPLAGPVGVLLGVAAVGVGLAVGAAAVANRTRSIGELRTELEQLEERVRTLQGLQDVFAADQAKGRVVGDGYASALRAAQESRDRVRAQVQRASAVAAGSDPDVSDPPFRLPFEGAKSIAEVTRGLKTRENIYRDATARMAELAKAYGNEIARANQGFAAPTSESRRLAAELQQQMAVVARERDEQLAALGKPAADAARKRAEVEQGIREREIGALSAIADERLDMQREELADLASLAKRGVLVEEDRVREELGIRRAFIEDLREVEAEKLRILVEAATREADTSRRDQLLKDAGQAQAKLDDLTRQQVAAERAAVRELEELAAQRANAVITSIARRVDAARAGVREMMDELETQRMARDQGADPTEARLQVAINQARARLAETLATEGVPPHVIAALKVEIALLEQKLKLQRELSAEASIAKQQEGWRRAEEQWSEREAERQVRAQEQRDEEISRSLTDALMRGFENGKSLAENFRDTLKNMFLSLVLRPQIELLVKPAANAVNSILTRLLEGVLGGSVGGAVDAALAGGASVVDLQGRFVPALGGGGPVQPNSLYLVGDRGGELLQTGSAGGRVYPNDITRAVLGAGARSGPATVVVKQYFDFTNSVGVGAVVQAAAQQGAAMGAAQAKAQIAEETRRGSREYS